MGFCLTYLYSFAAFRLQPTKKVRYRVLKRHCIALFLPYKIVSQRKTKDHAQAPTTAVSYHYIINYIKQSLPVEGGCCAAARERSSDAKDETKLVSKRTCTNKIHPHPSIKVLRSFFKSDRFPRSPVPPVIAGSHSPPRHKDGRCIGGIGGRRRREAPERHGGGADRAQRRLRRQRGARIRDRRRERP